MGWETIIYYAVVLIAGGVAYSGYQSAQKAAQAAMDRQRGLVYQVRSPIASRRVIYGTQRVGGIEAYVAAGTSSGPNPGGGLNNLIHYILIWGEGPCQSVRNFQLDGIDVPLVSDGGLGQVWRPIAGNPYAGHVRIEHRLGGTDNLTPLGQGVISGWTETDILANICFSWVELLFDPEIFPNGVPQISAVIEGRNDIIDPRDDSVGFTDNPSLCFAHYLALPRLGPGVDFTTEIAEDEMVAAANVCDEDVDGEKRYTFNGVIMMEDDPEDNIQRFRTAMAGSAVYIGGKWKFYAGAYITPTFTIGEAMLVDSVKLQSKVSQRDHINTVKGLYVGETPNNWQPTDFPAVTQAAYVTADGRELVQDINLPDTTTIAMARRIASITLERARRTRQVSVTCNVEAIRAQPALPVIFHFPALGFNNQPMDVLEWGFSIAENKLSVVLTLRETDPAIFDEPDEVIPSVFTPEIVPPVVFRRIMCLRHERYLAINSPIFAFAAQPSLDALRFNLLWGGTEGGAFEVVGLQPSFALPLSLPQAVAAADTTIRVKLLPIDAAGANPRRDAALLTGWDGDTGNGNGDELLLVIVSISGGFIVTQEVTSVNGPAVFAATDTYDVPVRRGRRWTTPLAFNVGSFPDAFTNYEAWLILRENLRPFDNSAWLFNGISRPAEIWFRYTPIGLGKTYERNAAYAEYQRRVAAPLDLIEFEHQTSSTHQPTDPFRFPAVEDVGTLPPTNYCQLLPAPWSGTFALKTQRFSFYGVDDVNAGPFEGTATFEARITSLTDPCGGVGTCQIKITAFEGHLVGAAPGSGEFRFINCARLDGAPISGAFAIGFDTWTADIPLGIYCLSIRMKHDFDRWVAYSGYPPVPANTVMQMDCRV